MNLVDLAIVLLAGFALWTGFQRGAVMQLFSWGGFLAGMVVGLVAAPPIFRAFGIKGQTARPVIALAIFLGIAFIIEGLIAFAGARIASKIRAVRAKQVDRGVGALVGVVVVFAGVWMFSLPAKRVPALAAAMKDSAILRAEYSMLSTPPDLFAWFGSVLSHTGFPEVFAALHPSLAPGVEPAPESLKDNARIRAAAALTFKIASPGCDGTVNGSGFPAERDLVITAAHVVAGTHDTTVIEARGGTPYPATVVYIDPNRDIAVLRVPSLPNRTLVVDDDAAPRNTDGAAIGYPGGGPERISVARVRARTDAVGYDIYSRRRVTRSIYVLRAIVRQGNSGGPFVDTRGRVRGMVFAASAQNGEESYALSEDEIERALSQAAGRTRQVQTGACAL